MSKVYTHMTMSLDGFIADPNDGIAELFDWYAAGEVEVPSANPDIEFRVDGDSAELLREFVGHTGALVCGRRLFDLTGGWGENHPMGAPVVVVTHEPPADAAQWKATSFVSSVASGIEEARNIAGDKDIVIASPTISSQALELGLVDEVYVSLVPVLLGDGIPYFARLSAAPYRLADPVVIAGKRATHLKYPVSARRDS